MHKSLLVLVVCFSVVAANRHVFTYVGFDHLLDYDPASGSLRAFDYRRELPSDDQCDAFVFPPLIDSAKFQDVVTSAMVPEKVYITYLGGENFLVQDADSGRYTVRRCSGFMPQQSNIPCEVWAVGHDPVFLEPFRYFFAGNGRIIRFNRWSQAFDLLSYDADVHGGGFPFGSIPILSGTFSAYPLGANVTFAYASIADSGMDVILALNEDDGEFKIWKYNAGASKDINDLVGQLLFSGSILPHYIVKTLGEDSMVAYNPVTGDFEIWRLAVEDGHLALATVKRDNIQKGHGCIFSNRQDCIKSPQCGWCGDSLTCHQLSSYREPCDGSKCLDLVDQYSSEHKKYQQYEVPIPSALRRFGSSPAVNPKSPLRKLHDESATPLLRDSDKEPEPIMEGVPTNPSKGIVFVPPKSSFDPCMDNEYSEPATPDLADMIRHQEKVMNDAKGVALPVVIHSPIGDASAQSTVDCLEPEPMPVTKNVTKRNFPAMNATSLRDAPRIRFEAPETIATQAEDEVDIYHPVNDGSAREADLMNGVASRYSSLIPRENDVAVLRPEFYDPEAPDTDEMKRKMTFKPREGSLQKFLLTPTPETSSKIGISKYSSNQMESNLPEYSDELVSSIPVTSGIPESDQTHAMTNAQFRSPSISNPGALELPAVMTAENIRDITGHDSDSPIAQMESRSNGKILEGWDQPSQALDTAQKVKVEVVVPEPSVHEDTAVMAEKAEAEEAVSEMDFKKNLEATAAKQGVNLGDELDTEPLATQPTELEKALAGKLNAEMYDPATGQNIRSLMP